MTRTRREFLATNLGMAAAALLPGRLLADPYHPLPAAPLVPAPRRVSGRVVAAGRPVRGARVTDGQTVVAVDRDGRFDFTSWDTQRYLSVCPPAGYDLPVDANGSLRLHRPIAAAPEQAHEFVLTPARKAADAHAFLVLADPQTLDAEDMARFRAETVPDVRATVSGLGMPSFGVGCGDLMFDDLSLLPAYERAVRTMGLPVAQVVGNHDLDAAAPTADDATATFRRHFGPPYYAFDVGQVHYVVLHDVFFHGSGYIGYLPEEQLTWLGHDLAHVERGRTVVVFAHIPVESSQYRRNGESRPAPGVTINNRQALYRALEGYRAHVIAGHTHELEHSTGGAVQEHVAGAVCGAWWTGDTCADGAPNGYAVWEARGDQLRWRYKATGRDAAYQVSLHAPGADPAAPADLVANVWDWDPAWTVTWFEDGQPRGRMSRRRGVDPAVERSMRGPRLPRKHGWVEPFITDHLFHGATSPAARSWRVEARDGVGRVYVATLDRRS